MFELLSEQRIVEHFVEIVEMPFVPVVSNCKLYLLVLGSNHCNFRFHLQPFFLCEHHRKN